MTREVSSLINPTSEDPGLFVSFEEHIIKARVIDGTESSRGKATIDILKLNDRADLVESRRRKWNMYQDIKKSISVCMSILDDGDTCNCAEVIRDFLMIQQGLLKDMMSDNSEFTGMFKYQNA